MMSHAGKAWRCVPGESSELWRDGAQISLVLAQLGIGVQAFFGPRQQLLWRKATWRWRTAIAARRCRGVMRRVSDGSDSDRAEKRTR